MPNSFANALPKWDVNWGSRSLITLCGSPYQQYTCQRYSAAICGPMIVVLQGRKMAALEHPWSTIVRMASYLLLLGSLVIRSRVICLKGAGEVGTGMWYSGVLSL